MNCGKSRNNSVRTAIVPDEIWIEDRHSCRSNLNQTDISKAAITDFSYEHIASIFKVQWQTDKASSRKETTSTALVIFCFLLASSFVTLQPWRSKHYILLKHRWTSTGTHGVISQKTEFFTRASVLLCLGYILAILSLRFHSACHSVNAS